MAWTDIVEGDQTLKATPTAFDDKPLTVDALNAVTDHFMKRSVQKCIAEACGDERLHLEVIYRLGYYLNRTPNSFEGFVRARTMQDKPGVDEAFDRDDDFNGDHTSFVKATILDDFYGEDNKRPKPSTLTFGGLKKMLHGIREDIQSDLDDGGWLYVERQGSNLPGTPKDTREALKKLDLRTVMDEACAEAQKEMLKAYGAEQKKSNAIG